MSKHTITYPGTTRTTECYRDDQGVFRWESNNAVCPLDACRDYGIAALPGYDSGAQQTARDKETKAFLDAYRKTPRQYTAEQRAEMRNTFGRGAKVINIFTGQSVRV